MRAGINLSTIFFVNKVFCQLFYRFLMKYFLSKPEYQKVLFCQLLMFFVKKYTVLKNFLSTFF